MSRAARGVGLVLGGLLLAGCTSPAEEPAGSTARPTASESAGTGPTPTPTPAVDAAAAQLEQDEAAILDVYQRFWDVLVRLRSGETEIAPEAFAGVASGHAVEVALADARFEADQGLTFEGAPSFSQLTVDVDGDTANVSACVDNTAWKPVGLEVDDEGLVVAGALRLERFEGQWLVTADGQVPDGFQC